MKYMQNPIRELPHEVGDDRPNGTRFLQGNAGNASYGPYCRLNPGRYFGGFLIVTLEQTDAERALNIDVCCNGGSQIFGTRWFSGREIYRDVSGLYGVEFQVERAVDDVEIRLYFNGQGSFSVSSLVLFRTDLV